MDQQNQQTTTQSTESGQTKFCTQCGQKIAKAAVICPHCGCQVGEMEGKSSSAQPQIVINNSNQNQNNVRGNNGGKECNKWVALLLCFFFGLIGAHKFYEGKIGMGILYIFTGGLFGIGVVIDFIALIFRPIHYYVR